MVHLLGPLHVLNCAVKERCEREEGLLEFNVEVELSARVAAGSWTCHSVLARYETLDHVRDVLPGICRREVKSARQMLYLPSQL